MALSQRDYMEARRGPGGIATLFKRAACGQKGAPAQAGGYPGLEDA